jgi:hypothetical protein
VDLLEGAARTFREYEELHRAKLGPLAMEHGAHSPEFFAANEKRMANAAHAQRIELFLAKPAPRGWPAVPAILGGTLDETLGAAPRIALPIATELVADPAVALSTADPQFDPKQPLTVNGYLFAPANYASPAISADCEHDDTTTLPTGHGMTATACNDCETVIGTTGGELSSTEAAAAMRELIDRDDVTAEGLRKGMAEILGRVDPVELAKAGIV